MSIPSASRLPSTLHSRAWIRQVSFLSVVLGVLLALALQTQRRISTKGLPPRYSALAGRYFELDSMNKDYEQQIQKLRSDVTKLENALNAASKTDSGRPQVDAMHKQMEEYKQFAGLVPMEGPGVEVVLSDAANGPDLAKNMARGSDQGPEYQQFLSEFMVHDQDIIGVVNELRAAGAEAIAVNGQRIIGTSSIRCVGPICYINGQSVGGAAPYTIDAIGSPRDLENGLRLPGGYLSTQQLFESKMVTIEQKDKIVIPKFEGLTLFKFAKPAPETLAAKPSE